MAALWLAHERRPGWAGCLLGLALLWKPQALVFVPVLALFLVRWQGSRALVQMAGVAAAVVVGAWLPYAREVPAFLGNVRESLREMPWTSANAWNLWRLLGLQWEPPWTPAIGGLSIELVGWILFAACAVLGVRRVITSPTRDDLFLGAAIVAVAFFAVAPLQHERYLVQAAPLLLAASVSHLWRLTWYVAASIAALLNAAGVALPHVDAHETIGVWSLHLGDAGFLAAPVAIGVLVLLGGLIAGSLAEDPRVPGPA
jgi:Gpi18-like mannosyltransferase